MTNYPDTIVAIATPPGRGGIGIVRVSGAGTAAIASAMLPAIPPPRHAALLPFRDDQGQAIDEGIALFYPAPNSYTGEDVLELQGHGGPFLLDLLVQRILGLGARLARPGEFSERAFLNDKVDLAQAEAIADLIDSGSTQAARAALRSLRGEFSGQVLALDEAVMQLRMYIEAAIDFPEEEIDFLSSDEVAVRLDAVTTRFATLRNAATQGCLLRDGMTVVIAGRPNAGKSSLLNRLAGYDAAIVTSVAGTTRDILREQIHIDGMPLHIIDTAGLRDSEDVVEREGMRRARKAMESADRVLLIRDVTDGGSDSDVLRHLPDDIPVTEIHNKIDIAGSPPGVTGDDPVTIRISALTGAGIDTLRTHLKACMGYLGSDSGTLLARRRHLDALNTAWRHVVAGREQLEVAKAGELMAEELRLAQQALGEITGEVSSDELLGRIFSSFCIGK